MHANDESSPESFLFIDLDENLSLDNKAICIWEMDIKKKHYLPNKRFLNMSLDTQSQKLS